MLAFKPVIFFNQINQLDWYKSTLRSWVDSNNFTPESTVLEVGCATGVLTEYLLQSNYLPTGLDFSEDMIHRAKANNSDIPFQVGDVNDLPFENNTFDSVISASLVNIVSDKNKALGEMVRVCKHEGVISILVPSKDFSDSGLTSLRESLDISGFSYASLKAWHELAPKMAIGELEQLLSGLGLVIYAQKNYLNGMIISVSARKPFSQ